jgi:hypothetical protein
MPYYYGGYYDYDYYGWYPYYPYYPSYNYGYGTGFPFLTGLVLGGLFF